MKGKDRDCLFLSFNGVVKDRAQHTVLNADPAQ